MGSRTSQDGSLWPRSVRKRAHRDHARRKAARRQKRHLRLIKSEAALRLIVLGSRHLTPDTLTLRPRRRP